MGVVSSLVLKVCFGKSHEEKVGILGSSKSPRDMMAHLQHVLEYLYWWNKAPYQFRK